MLNEKAKRMYAEDESKMEGCRCCLEESMDRESKNVYLQV